jgi:DNA-binding Lrp family transcriptional regulator
MLTGADRRLIARLCGDLPLETRPFAALADELGTTEADVIERIGRLERDGLLRRLGAIVRHRRAGIAANVMAVWIVPDEQADEVGAYAASFDEVSHCYLRAPAPSWPYTLYAMIHGRQPEQCAAVAEAVTQRFGLPEPLLLASKREFKKSSVQYLNTQPQDSSR